MSRLGLRARLAVALVAVALLAVGLAAVIVSFGIAPRVDQAARSRLTRSATHAADLAATVYQDSGGWTGTARTELTHLAGLEGLRMELTLPSGVVALGPAPFGTTASAAVLVGGRQIGMATVSSPSGALLTPEEQALEGSLDQLHLIAAGAAALAALVVGLLLAGALSRPLRRIRATAERLERGELDARVTPGGEPEAAALGRALNRLAETLEREEELRKASVADLAHELRTPVNGLLSRIEAAQDEMLPLGDNLSAMHDEAERLTRLVDDLARLADAERPGLLLEKQPVDLAAVASGIAHSFAPRFADAGIAFTTTAESVWVTGDPVRLEQIVTNLLTNARDYTEPGGEVQLGVRRDDETAVLEVSDTGVGIAAEDLRHLFTRFWRGDRSRSRAKGGAGLGLAIVRELVRAHDGRIEVDSKPGQGSRFRVGLPALDRGR